MVRTDSRDQKLDAFLQPVNKSKTSGPVPGVPEDNGNKDGCKSGGSPDVEMEESNDMNSGAVGGKTEMTPESPKKSQSLSPEVIHAR